VKLVDFGMVKLLDRGRPRQDLTGSQVLGTPLNMAPEQILGQPVDERTDIYALGLLLHQILTGTLPFRGATAIETEELHLQAPVPRLSDAVPVPLALDAVLQRALEKSRIRRYPSVGEFLADLRAAVVSRQTPAATQASMVGVYVQAKMGDQKSGDQKSGDPDGDAGDDDVLDDLERVLAAARSALASLDLTLAIESADAVLGAAPLPDGAEEATHFRQRVLEMAVALAQRLAERPAPLARVYLTAHVATATSRTYRGRLVLGGDLLRVRDWTAGLPPGDLVATDSMLEGLAERFRVKEVRPGSWVVK
jgi:serine/threonine-protein kinase